MIENGVGIGWYVRDNLTKEITSEIRCTGREGASHVKYQGRTNSAKALEKE